MRHAWGKAEGFFGDDFQNISYERKGFSFPKMGMVASWGLFWGPLVVGNCYI